jgi:hypothetical protein
VLKSNGTYQLLAYADDVSLLGDNIDTIKKDTETLIDASKEVGLDINIEKASICYCLVAGLQVKIRTQKKANRPFTVYFMHPDNPCSGKKKKKVQSRAF